MLFKWLLLVPWLTGCLCVIRAVTLLSLGSGLRKAVCVAISPKLAGCADRPDLILSSKSPLEMESALPQSEVAAGLYVDGPNGNLLCRMDFAAPRALQYPIAVIYLHGFPDQVPHATSCSAHRRCSP